MATDAQSAAELTGERGSLGEQLRAVLQRRILMGEIPVGTWLRHDSIAEEFAISRTPVREALRMLAAQGIVEIVPNKGARVNGLAVRDVLELGEVRAALEGMAARLATERINDEQVERLRRVWDAFDDAAFEGGRSGRELSLMWTEANDTFHSLIVGAAGNRQLSNSIAELRQRLPHNVAFGAYAGNSRLLKRNLDEHRAIADAVINQRPAEAERLMSEHILNSIQATVRRMESTDHS